jgi:hypothetical protein
MKRFVTLVAAVALVAPLAACGPRDRTGADGGPRPPAGASAEAATDALDELEALIGDVDAALTQADAHASADDDGAGTSPARFSPAQAAAPAPGEETVEGLKTALTARIDLRLAALDRERAAVTNARALTDSHRATLTGIIDESRTGLEALKAKVAGETTVAALRDDAKSMVDDYRVFLLVGPQVRLTIAGDVGAHAIERATKAQERLAEAVEQKKAGGADTSAAETDLAEMAAAIDRARAALDGQVEELLAIQPGPDGASIAEGVASVRRELGTCRRELRTAVAEGRSVVAFLRAGR